MINYQILIDGVDYTKFVTLPFKEQYVLDSALDNGVLTLNNTTISTIFKPFTPITIVKGEQSFNMYIFADKMTEIVGTGKYTHNLVLIEETKLLEKKIVDTNTTTQPLIHDYERLQKGVYVKSEYSTQYTMDTKYYTNESVFVLTKTSTTYLPSIRTFYSFDTYHSSEFNTFASSNAYKFWVQVVNTRTNTQIAYVKGDSNTTDLDELIVFNTPLEEGIYSVSYWIGDPVTASIHLFSTFEFWGYKQQQPRNKKSITDVVNRLLAITETLRESESPSLVFNQEQADFYNQRDVNGEPLYPAPEFSMTKSTLRECLDQVGGYIHSIVRLVGNTIYFDKLGGTNETTLKENYIGNYETLDGEQYASQLDTIVSNLTNIDDKDTGTIVEPFDKAYKTVRAETIAVRIGDGQDGTSAIIETAYPIEKIQSLECGWITVGGDTIKVGDITPYVYEKAEYDCLSSVSGTFPLSKGYAITYTQGEKNITGLTFKLPNPVSPVFSYQAIINIIAQKTGRAIQDLFNVQNITELHFRLVYYPSTTARVEQTRTDINNYSMELSSIYNQSANKVDSRAYGENLKGTIARLGNVEKFITYTTRDMSELVEVGDFVVIDNQDYYIATLNVENQIDHIKYTIGLSKDFNNLAKYIGIKNNIRLYEVSEKQSFERYVIRHDYCVIGTPIESDFKDMLTHNAKGGIVEQIIGYMYDYKPLRISVARVQGVDIDGVAREEVDLPVISLAMGNTLWFGFKFADNYSAGNQSVQGNSGGAYYRLNAPVSYVDYFGELEKMEIKMFGYIANVDNKTDAIESGNAFPVATLVDEYDGETIMVDTDNDKLKIEKDNREQLNIAYMLHFVTNDDIIIGSELAQGSPLIGVGTLGACKLYVLPNRINKFANDIDVSNGIMVYDYLESNQVNYNEQTNQVVFNSVISTASGKSWVLVDENNKLMFGKNMEIAENDVIVMPTMTYTHKVI